MGQANPTTEPTESRAREANRATRGARIRSIRRAWVGAVLAACLTAWMLWSASRVKTDRAFVATLGPGPEYDLIDARDAYLGWARPEGPGLWLDPGGQGKISYRISFDPGEKAVASLRARNDALARTQVVLQPGSRLGESPRPYRFLDVPETTADKPFATLRYDLTASLKGTHYAFFVVDSRREGGGAPGGPIQIVESLRFDFAARPAPRVRVASCVFFAAVCFVCWWVLFAWIGPKAAEGTRALTGVLRRWGMPRTYRRLVFAAMLVAAAFLAWRVVAAPTWRLPKSHDDRWALSNARLLAARRFHTDDLFFRSRVRPGFLALMLPFQTGLSYDLATTSYSPSDFQRRMFYVFERRDETWGTRAYPEDSILGIVFALLGLALAGRLAMRFQAARAGPLRAALALLFAAWFLRRILDTALVSPISLAATWLFLTAPMLAFAQATRDPKAKAPWAFAGILTGVAALFNESALTVALPIALYQIRLYWTRPRPRPSLSRATGAFWVCAALPPLIYYSYVIDGGFGEIAESFAGHLRSKEILENYEEAGAAGALRALYLAFGLGLPLAAAGIAFGLRAPRRLRAGAWFYLFWLLGCSSVFALPYVYPRFLIYMIPAMSWFAAGGLLFASSLLSPVFSRGPKA